MERLDDDELRRWLREDSPYGDLTTRSLPLGEHRGTLRFDARGAMRVAAIEEAARLFELCGCEAIVRVASGHDAAPGATLLEARGPAPGLLMAWKVAQTAVEAASGIASEAAHIVAALREAGYAQPLACTRKNWPGGRALAARGVRAGGAVMHRLGLSETLLVFPEHRRFLAPDALSSTLSELRAAQPEKKLVVEVGSADDALACARAGADVLQLERFAPGALAALRHQLDEAGLHPLLAPAGGVTRANALAFARAGADLLVSSAPYFAPPADVKVTVAGTTA
jgi:molybdenum transport protein